MLHPNTTKRHTHTHIHTHTRTHTHTHAHACKQTNVGHAFIGHCHVGFSYRYYCLATASVSYLAHLMSVGLLVIL